MTDPVNVALVGFGYWGVNLARNISASESLRLSGVVDGNESVRNRAESVYPGIRTWSTLEGALADPSIEAFVLATPASTHADLARAVLEADRHVMVEKPLAMSSVEARDIVALADERERIAMVGHTFLYSPSVLRLKEYVDSGDLGNIKYLYSQRLSLGRIRRDCNALWNLAPHDVSIVLYLLGERPTEVSATSLNLIDPALGDVFFADLRFPSGVGAHVHVSWIDPLKIRLMTVVGDEKMAVYDDVSVDQKLSVVDAGVARDADGLGAYQSLDDHQWRTRAGDILIPKIEMSEPLRNEMEAFGSACRSGEPPRTDVWHGAEVVGVLEAIDRSAERGGVPVEIEW